MLKPEQVPDAVAVALVMGEGGIHRTIMDAKKAAIAAALTAWPGMHLGHQCTGCGGDPQIILPLTEASDDQ